MTDREAFEAWFTAKADTGYVRRQESIAWWAWKAATLAERARCENLVLELPMKQSGMYWNDHCKSFAFYAATCIKAPEMFNEKFDIRAPEERVL